MSSRFNFPNWNYGYTLTPSGAQYYQSPPQFGPVPPPPPPPPPPPRFGHRGSLGVRTPYASFRGRGSTTAGGRGVRHVGQGEGKPEEASSEPASSASTPAGNENGDEESKKESCDNANNDSAQQGNERPLSEILRGRNAIMWCNDQSKQRGLRMEWEQVSETGPPHNKTFTWSLKMGDLTSVGSALSKKGAKNKAAEEMAKKLDKLPRPHKRPFHHFYGPGHMFYGQFAPPPLWMHMQHMKKRKMMVKPGGENGAEAGSFVVGGASAAVAAPEEGELPTEPAPAPPPPMPSAAQPQSNPISKLYEYCKHRKLNEPIFEVIQETVLEKKRTNKGFTLKKTEFTMQCEILGKKFQGVAMTKKQAKYNAAAAAWADIAGEQPQQPQPQPPQKTISDASIDQLLQECRNASSSLSSSSN